MTVTKAFRTLLGLAAALLVIWAFIDVTARFFRDDLGGRETLLRIVYWGNIEEDAIVREMVEQFEAEHPDIKVQPIHATAFDQKLKTMIASGEPPDLFYFRAEDVALMVDQGLVEPLDPYLGEKADEWLADFYPNLLDAFRRDVDGDGETKLWGLPKDFTTYGMYVNLDLFEQAGVEVPYDGWTFAELEEAARKITDLRTPENDRIFGVHFNTWPAVFQQMALNNGGTLFEGEDRGEPDYSEPTFTHPKTIEALDYIRRLRLEEGVAFNATGIAREGGNEFLTGNIGIIGPLGRWMTPTYRAAPGLRFDIVPLPTTPGRQSVGNIATTAWAISSGSDHKPEAFELLRFLTGREGAVETAELGLAIPALRSVAESEAFLSPEQRPANAELFLEMIDRSHVYVEPKQKEINQILTGEISAAAQLGTRTPRQAMEKAEAEWGRVLASPLQTGDFPEVAWLPILAVAGALVVTIGVILFWFARREKLGAIDAAQEQAGFLFISPWLIGFFALTLGPMVLSLILAFTRWSAMTPIGTAEFVGLENFRYLFGSDATFGQSLWVTAYYVVLAVPITQVLALAVAVLMANAVRGIELFRTIYFLPSVITGVAMGTLWLALFNNDFGLINEVLRVPLGWVGLSPPDWFGRNAEWAAIPAFVIMSAWGVGGAMVIYLAGLKNIPTSLYEAATIDGTGPWKKFVNITLPMLSPLVFFNLVMGIIGSFQVFTQAFVMTGRGPDNATLFYVLNLYYQAFESHNMGYASAMAWVLFVIILGFTLIVFRASKNLVYYEGLR